MLNPNFICRNVWILGRKCQAVGREHGSGCHLFGGYDSWHPEGGYFVDLLNLSATDSQFTTFQNAEM